MSKIVNIAIDGPSGAGKSSLARKIAQSLGYIYVDTGALYRSVAFYCIQNKKNTFNADEIVPLLKHIDLKIEYINGEQTVFLNGENVTGFIRTPEISMGASQVSAIPEVREFLFETQRKIARENCVVMDGRDIATVILPNADVKIFLTASDTVRARRRYDELKNKNPDISFDSVLKDMQNRDKNDSNRKVAPAVQAPDAILFDNSDLNFEQTLSAALEIIRDKVNI